MEWQRGGVTTLAPAHVGNNTVYVCAYVHAYVYVQDFHKLEVWSPAYRFITLAAKERISEQDMNIKMFS